MIDPAKLPVGAVEAARGVREFGLDCRELGGTFDFVLSEDLPTAIAAFLTALLEDDEARTRGEEAFYAAEYEYRRRGERFGLALLAAVQVPADAV